VVNGNKSDKVQLPVSRSLKRNLKKALPLAITAIKFSLAIAQGEEEP